MDSAVIIADCVQKLLSPRSRLRPEVTVLKILKLDRLAD
jgi:hypothetical protein